MSDYSEKLRDPRWQKRRLQILSRDEFRCQSCGDDTRELQIHHKIYKWDREIWQYEDDCLITLCRDCHKGHTDAIRNCKEMLSTFYGDPLFELEDILTELVGLDPWKLSQILKLINTFKNG